MGSPAGILPADVELSGVPESGMSYSGLVVPAAVCENRAAGFHEDEPAALADDRRRAVTSTHSADDGGWLQIVAIAPTYLLMTPFDGA